MLNMYWDNDPQTTPGAKICNNINSFMMKLQNLYTV